MRLNKKELLKLPHRKWDDTEKRYNQIFLVPSGKKHSSGYMHIAVIGVYEEEKKDKYEITAYPDDISCSNFVYPSVRMDCFYPSGVLRYHGDGFFTVSAAISSVTITFTGNL